MRKTQLLPTRLAHQKIERHGFGEGNIRMPKLNCIFMRVLREELPATEILILRYYSERKGKKVLSHCWHKLCNISRISRFYYTHTFSFLFRFFDGSWQFFRESRQLPKTSTQISVVYPNAWPGISMADSYINYCPTKWRSISPQAGLLLSPANLKVLGRPAWSLIQNSTRQVSVLVQWVHAMLF